MAKAPTTGKQAPAPVSKNIPASTSEAAEGIDFDDEPSAKKVEAPGIALDEGPIMIAINHITGLHSLRDEIRKGQRFTCKDKVERRRLLSLGAIRIAAEVDAERSEAEDRRVIEGSA